VQLFLIQWHLIYIRNGQLCIWNSTEPPEGFIPLEKSAADEIDPDDDETMTKEELLIKKRTIIYIFHVYGHISMINEANMTLIKY